MKLNQNEINAARLALEELELHSQSIHPSNGLAASATQNDYMKHPQRWTTTPRTTIKQATAIRHEEIKQGRALSEAEVAEVLQRVR
jgi:hypothetical protein